MRYRALQDCVYCAAWGAVSVGREGAIVRKKILTYFIYIILAATAASTVSMGLLSYSMFEEQVLGSLRDDALALAAVVEQGGEERLPGRDGEITFLPIDSKFPQEDYLRLTEASQAADRDAVEEARKALAQRMKAEARRISSKYIAPPHTTDFAVMFLPVEGLYAEVVQIPGLTEAIQREYRVVAAGPSTFAALLNALQMGFRTLAIEQRSGEVWKLLGQVKSDFGKFADTLDKTRQKLQQASESIDTAFTRTRAIQKRLGAVETLDSGTEEDA